MLARKMSASEEICMVRVLIYAVVHMPIFPEIFLGYFCYFGEVKVSI
jgi:hypothetical protein